MVSIGHVSKGEKIYGGYIHRMRAMTCRGIPKFSLFVSGGVENPLAALGRSAGRTGQVCWGFGVRSCVLLEEMARVKYLC